MINCSISNLAELAPNLTYSCNTAFGGIVDVKFFKVGTTDYTTPLFTIVFNDNDGFSNYSEEKTASLDGKVQCTQTLSLEVPKAANAEYVNSFSNPNLKFTALIETKAGKTIVVGKEFGLSIQSSNVSSGAQRSDKDSIQLTFVAEEINLCSLKPSK
jgi:hypothetical protein